MHAIGPDQKHGFAEREIGDCSPNWLGAARQDLGVLSGAQGPSGPEPGDPSGTSISIVRSGRGQSGYEVVDDATAEAACRRLASLGKAARGGDETPFCLAVGFILPHCPFVARAGDYDLFEGRVGMPTIRRPDEAREHPWLVGWRRHSGTERPDPARVLRARTAYWGLVHALDAKIGRILAALDEAGLAGNTLVIYASDHGEQIGERDLWWKNTFYEESVKVPLIMAWPGRVPEQARSARIVNLVDVGATMIDAAGALPLPRSEGRSLLPIATDPAAPWRDETFSEYVTDLSSPWTGPEATCQRMIRCGSFKYVHVDGYRPQLFDLETDPSELDDLGEHPGYVDTRRRLSERVLRGWDPAAIRREVDQRCAEKSILREWGRRTRPESTLQFPITAADSWLEGSS
jgi:choline-sulfatase